MMTHTTTIFSACVRMNLAVFKSTVTFQQWHSWRKVFPTHKLGPRIFPIFPADHFKLAACSLHITRRTLRCLLLYDSGETFAGSAAATAAVASHLKGTLHTSAVSEAEPLSESQICSIQHKDICLVYINTNIVQILVCNGRTRLVRKLYHDLSKDFTESTKCYLL